MMMGILSGMAAMLLILDVFFIAFFAVAIKPTKRQFVLWSLVILLIPILGFFIVFNLGPSNYSGQFPTERELLGDGYEEKRDRVKDMIGAENVPGNEETFGLITEFSKPYRINYSTDSGLVVFEDTNEYFRSLFDDIDGAREYVHIESFILKKDDFSDRFASLLLRKLSEGVKVRFICDYLGLGSDTQSFVERFKEAGGEFVAFHALVSLTFSPKKNNRMHRKILVIDGKTAYTGGINFSRDYIGKGPYGNWKDLGMRITGSTVFHMNIRFAIDWKYATGREIEKDCLREIPSDTPGKMKMQLVSSGYDQDENIAEHHLEVLFSKAKRSICIQTPYFVPTKRIRNALIKAAESGVDVRVMIPSWSDHEILVYNNRYTANRLMKHGIRVFMHTKAFLHSKCVVIDGRYCSTGSVNLDMRSLRYDFESNIIIYSEDAAKSMEDMFMRDLENCMEYSCEEYRKLPIGKKVVTVLSLVARPLL